MFVKLKNKFEKPLFVTVSGLESFAGLEGKGVYHKRIWSPDVEKVYSVIPKKYWDDFELTLRTINSYILPHIDNDLITAINFYMNTDNGSAKTVYYKPKPGAVPLPNKPALEVNAENYNDGVVKYVGDLYKQEDVYEIDSFTAYDNEAYLIDVTKIHNVIVNENFKLRKALTLRTKKYSYIEVYNMLKETDNVV
jgi:hypothetical protein